MRRDELNELHYIVPIQNLNSICTRGIVSHNRARELDHVSCAMEEIQGRREKVVVPGGRPLHHYVNLYFHARNPMMYKINDNHESLAVVQVNTDVLDIRGVVITDRNASSDYVRFMPAPEGLALISKELVFARDWTHLDEIEYWNRKSAKCAEVLVPERVDLRFLMGLYVSCTESYNTVKELLDSIESNLPVTINADLYFRA